MMLDMRDGRMGTEMDACIVHYKKSVMLKATFQQPNDIWLSTQKIIALSKNDRNNKRKASPKVFGLALNLWLCASQGV
ncbi:hypothetical protein H8B09_14325 [Paenibacillus sp. PR3]|uniref:Uncharacterized protein n=1 Tax=Paenibacillus terricola TaxID=2763503 RepID=A0ABR8MXB0_9BACL|nr:hypothetical protein [Paenibacillus terricola]MBD3919936.1 hypothetical protein [Paenibacillus terricola]